MSSRFAALLPRPKSVIPADGTLALAGTVVASGPPDWLDHLARFGLANTSVRPVAGDAPRIQLVEVPDAAAEWYRMTITTDGLTVKTRDRTGLARAIATLRQLLPAEVELPGTDVDVELPCGVVEDEPRFAWRGALIDVARHFQPLPWLFGFIDQLAALKYNVLHLHLTDDQGWRLEVPAWPRLVEVGSWRRSTTYAGGDDGTPHGGWYSLGQLRALDAYAAARGITIVPEVDLPGHARALLAAYPQFGTGAELPVATEFRIHSEIIHVTDSSMAMMTDIVDVLLDTFRGPWIHLGGDEAPMTEWEASDEAAEQMRRRELETPRQLEHWLMRHFAAHLAKRGRRLVGWDEVVEHQDLPEAVVLSWRGSDPGHRAARRGHDVVLTPENVVYLDRYQSEDPDEPLALRKVTTWEDVAAWDPLGEWPEDATGELLGLQAGLWGESTTDPASIEFQAFPRLSVMAEIAWLGHADSSNLRARLATQLERLELQGVNARPLDGPHPWQRGGTGRRTRREH